MINRQVFRLWKNIFSNWKYLKIAIIVAFLFYSLNVLVSSWSTLNGFYSTLGLFSTIKLFFILFFGFKETMMFHSFISLITISILFGILVCLLKYKINLGEQINKNKLGIWGSIGLFLGAFAPGCAACGIGLISVFGISAGVLSFLPYEGFEISLLAIVILFVAIIRLTKNMYVCKLEDLNSERRLLKNGNKKV